MIVLFRKWFLKSHLSTVKIFNATLLALGLNLCFGFGFYWAEAGHQEGLTLTDSIWWAMVTMTTVGYGDYYPVTFIGRFFIAYPCFLIGIGFIGFLFGIIVDSVLEQISKKKKGYSNMHLKNHYIICNSPSNEKILKIVKELRQMDSSLQVIVIDQELEEQPPEFKQQQIHFIKGDGSSEKALHRAALYNCAGVLILAKNSASSACDAETFAAGTVVKMVLAKSETDLSQKLILELVDRNNRDLLEKVGASGIVATEGISDHLLVQEIYNPGLSDIFDQLISYQFGSEFYLVPSQLIGQSLKAIQIAALHHSDPIQILGLVRNGETHFSSKQALLIEKSDQLLLLTPDPNNYQGLEQSLISSKQTTPAR
ncbi:MAG: ion channel [Verrucomicrobiales bacterium]|nr:ion channel [Verrucomicrobiales bacterium]